MSVGKTILTVLVLAVAASAETGAERSTPQWYTIIDLGTLGGQSSAAFGINDAGEVVGAAERYFGDRHAFLWRNGEMIDLGVLPLDLNSQGDDVNSSSQVVGLSTVGGASFSAFMWHEGTLTDLAEAAGVSASMLAKAINDLGHIVGRFSVAFETEHAFLVKDGVLQDLGTLGGSHSNARDINNHDQVVGSAYTSSDERAFLWEDGVMIDLGTLGGSNSEARAVNDLGQVVGQAARSTGIFLQAFLWDDGQMTDLGELTGLGQSNAQAINNVGQIVINAHMFDTATGVLVDLEDATPCDSGWSDLSPWAINNSAQIAGTGTLNHRRRAFLMTPSPTPHYEGPDCQPNGVPDLCDIAFGGSQDCNGNDVPDECNIAEGTSEDCNDNSVPDECDLETGNSRDCNVNGILDECDVDEGTSQDCNGNALPDECDLSYQLSVDCNGNAVPDECEPDSDGDEITDDCDVCAGFNDHDDLDGDGTPDGCDGCPDDANKTSPGVCGCNSAPEEDEDDDGDGVLNCTDQCPGVDDTTFAPECTGAIPTVSHWGMVVLTLIILTAGKICFARRAAHRRAC